jgi:transcriptional regulator with XRE-family HTH domain
VKQREKRTTNLKPLLERAKLTQRGLSDRINVTERNVNDWVRGVSYPRLDRAVDMARALNVSLEELCESLGLSGEGIPNANAQQSAEESDIPGATPPQGGDH